MGLISSTTSALSDATRTRRQLKALGVWDEGEERTFPAKLSAIGASERGDIARYGAQYAQAITEGKRINMESRNAEKRDAIAQQGMAGNAVGGFITAAPKAYDMGKEFGWWGTKPTPTTPAGNYPATEFGGAPAYNLPEVAPAASLSEALPPMGTAGMEAVSTGGLATTGGALTEAGTGLTTAIGVSSPEALALAYTPEVLAGVEGIAATMGAEAAAGAVTAGATDALVAAGGAAMVPGVGWVVGTGIAAAAGLMMVFGGGKDSVICTEMARQGKLDKYIWHYDAMYPTYIDPEVYAGYLLLFSPVAKKMKTSKILTNIVSFFGVPAATEMAHRVEPRIKGSLFGKIILSIGEPMCRSYYNLRRSLAWA